MRLRFVPSTPITRTFGVSSTSAAGPGVDRVRSVSANSVTAAMIVAVSSGAAGAAATNAAAVTAWGTVAVSATGGTATPVGSASGSAGPAASTSGDASTSALPCRSDSTTAAARVKLRWPVEVSVAGESVTDSGSVVTSGVGSSFPPSAPWLSIPPPVPSPALWESPSAATSFDSAPPPGLGSVWVSALPETVSEDDAPGDEGPALPAVPSAQAGQLQPVARAAPIPNATARPPTRPT